MAIKQTNLLGEYTEYGFSIKGTDDYILELYFKDNVIATYYQTKVTQELIREGCANYLKSLARWAE